MQKISMHEKAEESREFAARMQASLYAFSARNFPGTKNRGVKKAPFVVLIGAKMPSVLVEIGFLSNPREEALLRKPDYRQKLAEALFRGDRAICREPEPLPGGEGRQGRVARAVRCASWPFDTLRVRTSAHPAGAGIARHRGGVRGSVRGGGDARSVERGGPDFHGRRDVRERRSAVPPARARAIDEAASARTAGFRSLSGRAVDRQGARR